MKTYEIKYADKSKSAKAKCLADAAKKFDSGCDYYIYNIENV